MIDLDQEYLLGVYRRLPINVCFGKGVFLYDEKGNPYLDLYSGIAVNALGHQHPLINKAINKQSKKYLHLSNYFVSEPVVNLAKLLVENSFASKVFFTNSGTEAIEASIKLVRKYGKSIDNEKYEIIALDNSFHGRTIGGLSLTGQASKKDMFAPLMSGVKHIKRNDIFELREKVSDKTCAIVLELVQGEAGIHILTEEFIEEVKTLAKHYNFLIVIDEIQTGLMRTGSLFSYQQFSITPDIVTLAKSLGGGLPLGAMLVSKDLENVLLPGEHGSTFGGNPLACGVGEQVLLKLLDSDFQKSVNIKAKWLMNKLSKLKKDYPNIVKDVRGLGMMIGIDVGDYAVKIQEKAFKYGILLNVTNQTIIRLLPPLIISKQNLSFFIETLKGILIDLGEKHV